MIRIRNLNLKYQDKVVFEDFSFIVEDGVYLVSGFNDQINSLSNLIYQKKVEDYVLFDYDYDELNIDGSVYVMREHLAIPLKSTELEFMKLINWVQKQEEPFTHQPIHPDKKLSQYTKMELKVAQFNLFMAIKADVLIIEEPFVEGEDYYNAYMLEQIYSRKDQITIVTTRIEKYQNLFDNIINL